MKDVDRTPEFGWRWIAQCVFLRRRQGAVLAAVSAVVYAVGLMFPIGVQKAVDLVVAGHRDERLAGLALAILVATAFEAVLMRVRQSLIVDMATFIDRRIARRAFAHLMRARVDTTMLRSGDITNCFVQARKIQTFVLNDVPQCLFDVGGFFVSVTAIFFYDTSIGLLVIAATPLIGASVHRPLRSVRQGAEDYYKTVGEQQNVLSETSGAMWTVKSLGIENVRMRAWTTKTEAMLKSLKEVMRIQNRYVVTVQTAGRLLSLLVVALGCFKLSQGRITVGDLLALQILVNRVTGPMLQSSSVIGQFQEVNVAIAQIETFLAGPRETASTHPSVRAFGGGGIVLRGVSFTYPGASRAALRALDLTLPNIGVVAVVGRNGSGKSTLIRILLGLVRDYEGEVAFAGHDLRSYDPRWLRAQIGTVEQDTVLFSGSIRANLAGSRIVGDDQLRAALAFASAEDIVESLPGTLDAVLNENGRTLSGGQRQRLAIARAVLRDPPVAFLDEPSAFLDAEAAVALERRLAVWGRSRLLVIVSHHLAVIRGADRILVLDDGSLVGDGHHDDLLRTCTCYSALWADYTRGLGAGELAIKKADPAVADPDQS